MEYTKCLILSSKNQAVRVTENGNLIGFVTKNKNKECEVKLDKNIRYSEKVKDFDIKEFVDVFENSDDLLFVLLKNKANAGYYRKKNYKLLSNDLPADKINKFKRRDSKYVVLNKSIYDIRCVDNIIEFIDEEEYNEIMKNFYKLDISDYINSELNSPCISSVSGEPKIAFKSKKHVLCTLHDFRLTHKDKHFEAYVCPVCGNYHIGKPNKI